MASHQEPDNKSTVPQHDDDVQQTEVFAASAAEGTIVDRKDPADSEQLQHLTISTEQASLADIEKPQSAQAPSAEQLASDPAEQPDRILSKEQLVEEALNCPCIASMRDGPCGDSFIAAYKCFLESETEPKGMDCMDQFKGMQSCMADHPEEYNLDDDDDEDADPFAAQKTTPTSSSPDKPNPNPADPPMTASS